MRLLFIHQNFPAQYRFVAPHFARDRKNSVVAIGEASNLVRIKDKTGPIRHVPYEMPDVPATDVHRYLRGAEVAVRRAQQVREAAAALKREGFTPDIICAHPGWGETLLLRDVFPESSLLAFCEFFFRTGWDAEFDPEFPARELEAYRIRIKNSVILRSFDQCDWGVTPTNWQLSQFPRRCRNRISVIFDGIDTKALVPDPNRSITVNNVPLKSTSEVITFASRNLEPCRGFHVFMRCLPRLLRERPEAHVLIVGGEAIGYGQSPLAGRTWRQVFCAELAGGFDDSRVHFLGQVPYVDFVALLQLSSVHVYLTYPFVLSWSMIEAMSCGCAVVGSATAPVSEVIRNGENGLLVDFFDTDQIVDAINRVLEHPDRMQAMRMAARQTVVERYDLTTVCLPRHVELIERIAGARKA
jgi:glycosyltransferase involved in cell wall biosynthesis